MSFDANINGDASHATQSASFFNALQKHLRANPPARHGSANETVSEISVLQTQICKKSANSENFSDESMFRLMVETIYGGNFIEDAGLDMYQTREICAGIFRAIPLTDVLDKEKRLESEIPKAEKGRKEVIQHARAFVHIVTEFVINNQSLTEELMKSTHAILCDGDHMELDSPPGGYRDHEVAASNGARKRPTLFLRAKSVPTYMRQMCEHYEDEIRAGNEVPQRFDPIELAAKYCTQFVNIHPLSDGNGRTCRLILNAILLKYMGVCAPIAGNGDIGSEGYLDLTKKASKVFHAEDMVELWANQTSHLTLRDLIARKLLCKLKEIDKDLS